ncbi:MAG TPA: right-handed parallel beta-helix repeat-containing protein [Pirellulaceae bacterium]|nr:right-handed parallel beta-helix repeat-containing protein [Pirellulaceae bacterium]HMO90763.1 right-handed parallel beta-helix repeat-containing protein [Pirellulaceae bacterium]
MSLRLIGLGLTLAAALLVNRVQVNAQYDGLFDNAYQPTMMGEIPTLLPGRLWIGANVADRGLGYDGSYVTLGTKTHLFHDFLDGRWLFEGRGHVSVDRGGFFANLGIERVFSLPAAGADISSSFWFDYDDDQVGDFAHTMTSVGVSAAVKTRRWDLYGNGYLPIGSSDFAQGDPTGQRCFLGNSIVLQAGIDSALTGFDAMFRYRPSGLAHINGSVEFGGYHYDSQLVEEFSGVRVRTGAQFMRGLIVSAELNHDNRFDFTGVLGLSLMFGGNARGTEYGLLGRDLEPTVRNDHIVRFQQDLILAIDPDTGLPYNVFHVDNTADAAFADGTFETRFVSLDQAEAASGADDIIFVHIGDGTTRNMDAGIVLKDGQLLLGEGVQHLIPIQGNQFFILCNNIFDDPNLRPRITNNFGGPGVTLANRNTVRGLIIDGEAPGALMSHGILAGNGATNTTGIIEDVTILGAVLNGINLQNIAGDWSFARNRIERSGFHGIFINNAIDPTSRFDFVENQTQFNIRNGIFFDDYNGSVFNFERNVTSNNLGSGIVMRQYNGTRGVFDFIEPIASGNTGSGISIIGADGNLRILNATILNNGGAGVSLVDFTNTHPADSTLIGTFNGGTSNISGNLAANINIWLRTGQQQVLITDSTLDGGGTGILARATNAGSDLNIQVLDNLSVSNNISDGMRFIAETAASINVLVENTGAALNVNGNGQHGITYLVGDDAGGAISSFQGVTRNININGSGVNGIFGATIDDGQLDLTFENININASGLDGMQLLAQTNPNGIVNLVRTNNMTITNSGRNGVTMQTNADSNLDFVMTNSLISNGPALPDAAGNQSGGIGFAVTTFGGVGAPVDDSRTRLFLANNTIQGFRFGGMSIDANGDSRVLATLNSNVIQNNGEGLDPTELPYFHGLSVTSSGTSVVNLEMNTNLLTNNWERGLFMQTFGSGTINAVLVGNAIANNDFGEDATDPPFTSGFQDALVINGPLGNISIAMSNNFFALDVTFANAGGAPQFIVELDGLTNGFGVPTLAGPFTLNPFSLVAVPTLDAEKAAFEAAGFPPQ